jgi:ABC-type transporter Mla maintaining outer membrane lipid asymmetry ATPase subunit MlaF
MIELKDVKKSFGSNHVLRGVNLMVERGTSMVIIGGSGTGKSIAIKSDGSRCISCPFWDVVPRRSPI